MCIRDRHDFYPVKVTDVHINGKPSTYPMVTVGSGISRIGLEPSEKDVYKRQGIYIT